MNASRSTLGSMLLLAACLAIALAREGTSSAQDADGSPGVDPVRALLLRLDPASEPATGTIAELLWSMAGDPDFSDAVLARAAQERPRALTDTLLSFVRLTDPLAREQLPGLYRIQDGGPPREQRPPAWADVQWQGVRLLRILAPDPAVGRDLRLQRELDAAMEKIDVPRPASVGGAVVVLEQWWAERGDAPALTHDTSRILDVEPWLRRLALPADDPEAWQGPRMVADLDSRPALRERLLPRLSPETHAHLAAELVQTLETMPDSFAMLGIEPARWDPQVQRVRGHAAIDLWRLSIRMLEIVSGEPISGADDTMRRFGAFIWWDRHDHLARYYRDPWQAPRLDPYLEGLDRPEDRGGQNAAAWLRSLYVDPSLREIVLDRLGERGRPLVGELVALLPLDRSAAHAAGFTMAVRRRLVTTPPGSSGSIVGIDWQDARDFLREVLSELTGVEEPAGLDEAGAERFWMQWWEDHRLEPQWWRGDPPSRRR